MDNHGYRQILKMTITVQEGNTRETREEIRRPIKRSHMGNKKAFKGKKFRIGRPHISLRPRAVMVRPIKLYKPKANHS